MRPFSVTHEGGSLAAEKAFRAWLLTLLACHISRPRLRGRPLQLALAPTCRYRYEDGFGIRANVDALWSLRDLP